MHLLKMICRRVAVLRISPSLTSGRGALRAVTRSVRRGRHILIYRPVNGRSHLRQFSRVIGKACYAGAS